MIHSRDLKHIYEMQRRKKNVYKLDMKKAIQKHFDDIEEKKTCEYLDKIFGVKNE